MKASIIDISLSKLDKVIMDYHANNRDDASYIVMSSKTATEICKNVEELSNKVFSHNATPSSNAKCRLSTYRGYVVAINDDLMYGEVDIV